MDKFFSQAEATQNVMMLACRSARKKGPPAREGGGQIKKTDRRESEAAFFYLWGETPSIT